MAARSHLTAGLPASLLAGWLAKCPSLQPRARLPQLLGSLRRPPEDAPPPPRAGVVCDRGLTLGDLIGTLTEFFRRLGLKKLRFKPAYNPYTEPSMEIFR